MTITVDSRFTVRVVRKGDTYGRDDFFTHNEDAPLVEFYDNRYPFTPHGQFVSRYYCKTLLAGQSNKMGLDLQGDVPDWKVSADGMAEVFAFIN